MNQSSWNTSDPCRDELLCSVLTRLPESIKVLRENTSGLSYLSRLFGLNHKFHFFGAEQEKELRESEERRVSRGRNERVESEVVIEKLKKRHQALIM